MNRYFSLVQRTIGLQLFVVMVILITAFSSCKKNHPLGPQDSALPDSVPPTVVITYPTNGAFLMENVIIRADANDNVGVSEVEFKIDGVTVFTDKERPFEFAWNVGFWADSNSHTILARAKDHRGNIGQSQLVTVIISKDAIPIPELVDPADSTKIDSTKISFRWRRSLSYVSYEYQLSSSENFAMIDISGATTDTTVDLNLTPILYPRFWRIRGINGVGKSSEWSVRRRFLQWCTYGGTGDDEAKSIIRANDGGFIICGAIDGKVALLKTNAKGILTWQKTYLQGLGKHVARTSDGGYVVVGITNAVGGGGNDLYLLKVDWAGNKTWDRTFGGGNDDEGNRVLVESNNNFVIVGSTKSYGLGGYWQSDIWLLKTSGTGDLLWSKTFGSTGTDEGRSLIAHPLGGYFLTGCYNSEQLWFARVDDGGELLWEKKSFNDNPYSRTLKYCGISIARVSDTLFAVAAYVSYGYLDGLIKILSIDSSGNCKSTYYGGWSTGYDQAEVVSGRADGWILAVGGVKSGFYSGAVIQDYYTDVNGILRNNMGWSISRNIGDNASSVLYENNPWGSVACGTTDSGVTGGKNIWLVRTGWGGIFDIR